MKPSRIAILGAALLAMPVVGAQATENDRALVFTAPTEQILDAGQLQVGVDLLWGKDVIERISFLPPNPINLKPTRERFTADLKRRLFEARYGLTDTTTLGLCYSGTDVEQVRTYNFRTGDGFGFPFTTYDQDTHRFCLTADTELLSTPMFGLNAGFEGALVDGKGDPDIVLTPSLQGTGTFDHGLFGAAKVALPTDGDFLNLATEVVAGVEVFMGVSIYGKFESLTLDDVDGDQITTCHVGIGGGFEVTDGVTLGIEHLKSQCNGRGYDDFTTVRAAVSF